MVGSPPALQLPDELLRRGDGLRGDGRDPALSACAAYGNKGANGSQPCALARTLLLPGHRQPRPGLQDGVRGNANAGLAVELDVRPQFRQEERLEESERALVASASTNEQNAQTA
jgi:hypothetical protein